VQQKAVGSDRHAKPACLLPLSRFSDPVRRGCGLLGSAPRSAAAIVAEACVARIAGVFQDGLKRRRGPSTSQRGHSAGVGPRSAGEGRRASGIAPSNRQVPVIHARPGQAT
jgi:hypothetical protein